MSIIIGLCIKKFEKKKKEKAWPEKKTTLKMCSVLTIKLLMKKKIEKVINKEIKKKRGLRGVF